MMRKFMLFVLGLAALLVLLVNLGPMILLGAGIWLLYAVFKKFLKTGSTFKKACLLIIGLIIASISVFNMHAVVGLVAGYVLYAVYRKWNSEPEQSQGKSEDDPFESFEKQWAELQSLKFKGEI